MNWFALSRTGTWYKYLVRWRILNFDMGLTISKIMLVEQMAHRVQVFVNFQKVGMQSFFRDHLHIGKPYAAAQFADHEIDLLKTVQISFTLQPFKMLMQLNNRKLNRTRKICIKDDLVKDIPCFKSGTVILQVKLIPGNGQ